MHARRALITGISGFAGSHLAQHLLSSQNYRVFGTYLTDKSLENVRHIKDKIELIQLDLTDQKRTYSFIRSIKPDVVFHLAAIPSVGASFQDPLNTIVNNIAVQINLLEGIRQANLGNCKILIVSSADVYGMVKKDELPISEETPFRPTNSYAVSKITQDFLGLQYGLAYNFFIIRVRPFNHIGPKQQGGFVVADFARKIAEIERGKGSGALMVGDLRPKRDFTDVRDIVRAYTLLMEKGKPGEAYNVGSGVSYAISDILRMLLSFSSASITVKEDSSLIRPGDSFDRECDNAKIYKDTAWKPIIPIEQSLKDTLDYWRKIV
ncbi:MAG: hypothetical protein A3J69_02370 [Candidatus Levybacteria bacterium RIFCSPHIGHO2_02_FULL_42_12]|nr:MAG: hypothetical protein A3J69_02370 [Candidatus Levybacteria bacterium RIFCSPHIGHO2_02_FULL_42_12]OGH42790.1 MAG: hypothetical protein A3B53_01605 [Candidatus Levybacteria bacterium RIFCSPLOWO2_01_FULL_42_15]